MCTTNILCCSELLSCCYLLYCFDITFLGLPCENCSKKLFYILVNVTRLIHVYMQAEGFLLT